MYLSSLLKIDEVLKERKKKIRPTWKIFIAQLSKQEVPFYLVLKWRKKHGGAFKTVI